MYEEIILKLQNKLDALKVSGRVSDIKNNDFFTIYTVDFADDVTINKIRARREDLEIFFEGAAVTIESTGRNILLKVSKDNREPVNIAPYINEIAGGLEGFEIPFILGRNEDGGRLYYDLCKMPHLLAGGSTGSGKSVFMHNCILSTLYSNKSSIILIDVKRVEFNIYKDIPHLATPICYTAGEALKTLKTLCGVMDKRYNTLEAGGFRNIKEYRDDGGKMQYITVFIDELADVMMSNRYIEKYIIRLAQLGRAAGIHLVVATQRPDASILSGLIRANIPTRVCFAVQKATDSRIILDMPGGETLRGAGDGLFVPIGSKTAARFQAPYISTAELEDIIERARHCND